MLRSLISRLMVVALLMMSLEGAIDSVFSGEDTHTPDAYAHNLDNNDGDNNGHEQRAGEQGSKHCENCCHGHISCLSTTGNLIAHSDASPPLVHRQLLFQYLSLAPPTPPPNA